MVILDMINILILLRKEIEKFIDTIDKDEKTTVIITGHSLASTLCLLILDSLSDERYRKIDYSYLFNGGCTCKENILETFEKRKHKKGFIYTYI